MAIGRITYKPGLLTDGLFDKPAQPQPAQNDSPWRKKVAGLLDRFGDGMEDWQPQGVQAPQLSAPGIIQPQGAGFDPNGIIAKYLAMVGSTPYGQQMGPFVGLLGR